MHRSPRTAAVSGCTLCASACPQHPVAQGEGGEGGGGVCRVVHGSISASGMQRDGALQSVRLSS